MTENLLLAGGLILVGLLGWVLPYRFNILRLKRFAQVLVPEAYRTWVPKIVGSLLILAGLTLSFVFLVVLKSDPRGIPITIHNRLPVELKWAAVEFPSDQEQARQGPVAPDQKVVLYFKPAQVGRAVIVYLRSDETKTRGGEIPINIGPGSLGDVEVSITSQDIEVTDGIVGK